MGFPTAQDLMVRFRREVDDRLSDPANFTDDSDRLWGNAEIYDYMHAAQHEVARVTRGLLSVVTAPVVAGSPYVTIRGALEIQRVELVSSRYTLGELNNNETAVPRGDYGNLGVNSARTATGTPRYYTLDAALGRMRLAPIPTANDTLEITMIGLPRADIDDGSDDCAFSDPKDIRLVLYYMKFLAYSKQDTDTLDNSLSASFKAKFDQEGDEREHELEKLRRRPGVVRYGGI